MRAQGSERSSSAQPSHGTKIEFLLKTLNLLKISPPALSSQVSHVANPGSVLQRLHWPWCWVPPSSAGTRSSFLPLIRGENDPRRKPRAKRTEALVWFVILSECPGYSCILTMLLFVQCTKSLRLKRKLRVRSLGFLLWCKFPADLPMGWGKPCKYSPVANASLRTKGSFF